MMIVAFVLGGYGFFVRIRRDFFHAILVGETGPIESQDDWPDPLKALIGERPPGMAIESIKVYQLCQGFDPEFVFRMDASPDLRDHVIDTWKLTKVESPPLRLVFDGRSSLSGVATPNWWTPSTIPDIQYFVCPQTLANEDGDRFQIAYSEANRVLFVHYWFDF